MQPSSAGSPFGSVANRCSSGRLCHQHDVDAILLLSWLAAKDEQLDFREAQQRANGELEPEGLYLTRLFRKLEVILTPDWLSRRVRIPLELPRLAVFRPAPLDLIPRWRAAKKTTWPILSFCYRANH